MLIGLDIGTSSVKGILTSNDGKIIKTAHEDFDYTYLANGGVEISAEKYITACFDAIRELSKGQENIDGFCASSASGNLLVLDKDNKPSTPIYNWQDTRVKTEAKEVLGELDLAELKLQMGWPFSYDSMPLALLCYVKKHNPEKIQNCGMVCMSTEYLYYRLTGKWGISTSAGTPFYLIDQRTGAYISEILEKLDIAEEKLPPIMECGTVLGNSTKEAEKLCGLKENTPIVLGSFDHPSAARGVGILNEGEMLLSCGTSWVAFMPVMDRGRVENEPIALTDPFLFSKGGAWATMVSVESVSQRIELYAKTFIDDSDKYYEPLSNLAKGNSSEGLVLCLTDEPDDSKVIGFSKENIARAIMEGAAYLLKDKIELLNGFGLSATKAVMVGGPSSNPLWIEIISEICNLEVTVRHGKYAGAVGAAILSGIGTGFFKDEKDAAKVFNGGM